MNAPGSPPEKKAGWLDRVLELGNSNKLIAVATLITVATGVPYLVNVVLGAFGGEEPEVAAPPAAPVITAEMLAEAMAASMEQVREQAERAAAEGIAQAQEEAVAAADRALEALGESAARPEATPEERERIMKAYQQYAMGDAAAALDEFTRVATAQEERGALEQAAETWRHRGAIQYWEDRASALVDYQHAEELAPGNAAHNLALAMLYLNEHRIADALTTLRHAIRLAREEEDLETLAHALFTLAFDARFIEALKQPISVEEKLHAADEGIDVLEELLETEPHRVRLIGMQAQLMRNSAALRAEPTLLAGFDEYLHEKIDQVQALQHPSVSDATRNAELGVLHGLHCIVIQARGLFPDETEEDRQAELWDEYRNALDCAWAALEAPRLEPRDLPRINMVANEVLIAASTMGREELALEAIECGLAMAREFSALVGSRSGEGSWMLGRATQLFRMGRLEEAKAQSREGFAVMEESVDAYGDLGRAWGNVVTMRLRLVTIVPPEEEAFAEEVFDDILEIGETRLDERNRRAVERAVREARDAFAARAAGEVSG